MEMPEHRSEEELPTLDDVPFSDWLKRQFNAACKRERRWKTHLDQAHAVYECRNARNTKRMIRECATYELLKQDYEETTSKVLNILAKSTERNELNPGTFQRVKALLETAEKRHLE